MKTSNKNFILKCRDGKRTETRIWMEGTCITHSCIPPLNYVLQVHSIQWNAGMGNTDILHPNSCFCSFSIPTSTIKNFVTCFYGMHAHETTPTSIYKLSHAHIFVEEGP